MERGIFTEKKINLKVRRLVTALTASLLILTGCKIATPTPSQIVTINPNISPSVELLKSKPYSISPELLPQLTPTDLDNIDKAYNLQQEVYGCKTKINFLAKDLGYKTIKDKDINYFFPEETVPGSIWLDMNLINNVNNFRNKRFYNIILHALQHGCDPQEIYKPKNRLILSNGNEVVGFQGFSVKFITPKGQTEWFHLFEEGSAEFKSIRADPEEYMPQSFDYMDLEYMFNSLILTYADLNLVKKWDETSDVMGFVGQILGKKDPKAEDLKYLMDAFKKVKDKEAIVPILHEIYNRREKQSIP